MLAPKVILKFFVTLYVPLRSATHCGPKLSSAEATVLTAWSIAGRSLPVRYATLLGNGTDDVPLAAWGARYATEPVVEVLQKHPNAYATLLANHGPFVWGDTVLGVARQLVFLEEASYFTFLAEQLGGARELPAGAYEAVQLGKQKYYA